MRKIKVMADFSSSGLWDEDRNGVMIDYEDLGLLTDLITEFEEWIRHYDMIWTKDYHAMMPGKAKENEEMGRKLAKQLKALFPEDHIEFWYENEKAEDERYDVEGDFEDWGPRITKEIINA